MMQGSRKPPVGATVARSCCSDDTTVGHRAASGDDELTAAVIERKPAMRMRVLAASWAAVMAWLLSAS